MITADDGVRLWLRDAGNRETNARAVVCCHGGPGIADYLQPIEDLLGTTDRVIRWDQRGSGRSEHRGPFSTDRFVADVDCLQRTVGLDRFVLFGHSWGANLAMLYAQRHHEQLQAIIYVSGTGLEWAPTFKSIHKRRQQERLGPRLGERLTALRTGRRTAAEEAEYRRLYIQSELHDVTDATLAEAIAEHERRYPMSRDANRELNRETAAMELDVQTRGCRAITCPVLVLHGQSDPRPIEALDSLLDALPDPTVRVIAEAGHLPWLDQPDQFVAELNGFLGTRSG